jgi:hypothetical protein
MFSICITGGCTDFARKFVLIFFHSIFDLVLARSDFACCLILSTAEINKIFYLYWFFYFWLLAENGFFISSLCLNVAVQIGFCLCFFTHLLRRFWGLCLFSINMCQTQYNSYIFKPNHQTYVFYTWDPGLVLYKSSFI